jgi:hypothetical protein
MTDIDTHVVGVFFAEDSTSPDLLLKKVELGFFGRFDFHNQKSVLTLVEELRQVAVPQQNGSHVAGVLIGINSLARLEVLVDDVKALSAFHHPTSIELSFGGELEPTAEVILRQPFSDGAGDFAVELSEQGSASSERLEAGGR